MSFMKALENAHRSFVDITSIPEQQRTQRQRQDLQELIKINEDIQARAAARAAQAEQAGLRQAADLAPGVQALQEASRNSELGRTLQLQNSQTQGTIDVTRAAGDVRGDLLDRQADGTVRSIAAQYDGAGNLVRTQGDINLRGQESQQQAALKALGMTQGHELGITGKFIGDGALVPQVIDATRGMRTEELDFMRELAKMNQPNTFERALTAVGPLALAVASLRS
jgi:hypothetical protein